MALMKAITLFLSMPAAPVAASPSSPLAGPVATPTLDSLIAEASRRFGVPASWIAEVMAVESRGRTDALSPKGAIGLMQVMPTTYAGLASRYGLGTDPWTPRDNVLAGAAYLRELYDRYGAPGFLVAYNAGPARWEDYLARARPLPAETIAYIARLAPILGAAAVIVQASGAKSLPRSPYSAPLFVQLRSIAATSQAIAERQRIERVIDGNVIVVPQPNSLFATHAGGGEDAASLSSNSRTGAARDKPTTVTPTGASSDQVDHNPIFAATSPSRPRP